MSTLLTDARSSEFKQWAGVELVVAAVAPVDNVQQGVRTTCDCQVAATPFAPSGDPAEEEEHQRSEQKGNSEERDEYQPVQPRHMIHIAHSIHDCRKTNNNKDESAYEAVSLPGHH